MGVVFCLGRQKDHFLTIFESFDWSRSTISISDKARDWQDEWD